VADKNRLGWDEGLGWGGGLGWGSNVSRGVGVELLNVTIIIAHRSSQLSAVWWRGLRGGRVGGEAPERTCAGRCDSLLPSLPPSLLWSLFPGRTYSVGRRSRSFIQDSLPEANVQSNKQNE